MAKSINFSIKLKVDGKETLTQATASVKDLKAVVESSNSAMQNALSSFNNYGFAVQGISSSIDAISKTLNSLTEESRSFSGAMAAANTMAGKGGEDFAKLKAEVAELSKTLPIARDELANGLYQVISNGVPEDNWLSYLEKSAKASVGGIADLGEVVKVTSTIIKNYGMDWSDAESIQDKIQLTAKNGVTSFEQLAQALPRVSSNAATLGVSMDELMASFATLTGVSGNTAEVSTQLAAIFTALIKPSSEAATMAQQMGIQFDAAAIKAAGGMSNFLASLNKDVKKYAASSGMLEQEIYGKLFGSAESLRAIGPLTGQLADTFQKNIASMANSAGTVEGAFNTMGNTGSAELQKLKNQFSGIGDAISGITGKILPTLNFSSQLGMSVVGIMGMKNAFSKLAVSINVVSLAKTAYSAVVAKLSVIVRVFSAALTGTAYSATAAKLAIKGLMITTVVGAAIAALTTIIEKLTLSMDEVPAKSQAMEEAEQAYTSTAANTKVAIDSEIKKLEELIKTKQDAGTEIKKLNDTYGSIFGSHQKASEWYDILTKKSQVYVKQIAYEAQAKVLATKLAEKQIQLELNYENRRKLWKDKKAVRTVSRAVGTSSSGQVSTVTYQEDTEAYKDLKDEARGLLPEIQNLQRQLGIAESKMQSCAAEIKKITFAGSEANKVVKTSEMSLSQVEKAITQVETKLKNTTDKKTINNLRAYEQQLQARKKALEKETGIGSYSKKDESKKEPKFYQNPKTEAELTKNISYWSKKLNGQDTLEQRNIIANIQKWKEKKQAIELANKEASRPTELKTLEDVEKELDYLNLKRKYAKSSREISTIDRQISVVNLKGAEMERPGELETMQDIDKEIKYQQALRETADKASVLGIDKEIERLELLKEHRTNLENLQAQLQSKQKDFDNAVDVKAKLSLSEDISKIQAQIDQATKGELSIKADVVPSYIVKGSIEDRRQSYSNAQNKANRVQSDFDIGIIDKNEAQRQIDEINEEVGTLGDNLKPIKIELDVNKDAVEAIKSLGNIDLSNMDSVKSTIENIQKITDPTAKGFASAGAACTALGGAMQQLGADSAAAKAGLVMAAIGQIALSFAQAMQSASSNWITWLAFGITGTAQMISMISAIAGFATGGIVGGTSTSGDKIPVRVNSGEMILNKQQQARLFAIADGKQRLQGVTLPDRRQPSVNANPAVMAQLVMPEQSSQSVKFKIDGRTLVGVLANETRISSRSGRRTNIEI